MSHAFFQYTLLRQRERDLEFELEQERLAATAARLRPPLRHQLGAALIRLGTWVADGDPASRRRPCATA